MSAILAGGVALGRNVARPRAAAGRGASSPRRDALQGPQATFLSAADNGCFAREKLDVVIDRGFGSGDAVVQGRGRQLRTRQVGDLSVLMEFNARRQRQKACRCSSARSLSDLDPDPQGHRHHEARRT